MKKLKAWLHTASAEILLLLGAFLIIGATATISIIAAVYLTGGVLVSLGFFIAKNRR